MAKETMIVFVYDTECLRNEADDPISAVLYFHPSWVSDTQKVALCGQLMGTSYFLKENFFKPRILALQNGKFVLKEFGRFILAIGTDRNMSDNLLEHRAELLVSLIRLFHRDLQSISDHLSTNGQCKNISERLYHIFETYLPILQCQGNIFQNITKLRIPKTASNIFLDAIQTLQCCQQTKGILGGMILYHNKVVATQLSDKITKQLVLTDPLHIRTTAEQSTSVDFHIPNGVQMIVVYIDAAEYRKLSDDAQRAQNLQTQQLSNGPGGVPFSLYCKRKMKRDKSLIFTNIPEEGNTCMEKCQSGEDDVVTDPPTPLVSASTLSRPKSHTRPTHLPLRFKNVTAKEQPESGIGSINFNENDSYPEFIGRTSVCSTPMTENKVLQVGTIMSICANPEDESNSNRKKVSTDMDNNRRNSLKMDLEKFFQNFITNPNKMERRNSFTDLQDTIKRISKKFSLKNKSTNGWKADVNRNDNCSEASDFIENDDNDTSSENSIECGRTSRTISDPTYPVFNANGQPISRSLFQEFLGRYYSLWDTDAKQEAEIAQLIEEYREFDNELKQLNATLTKDNNNKAMAAFKADRNLNIEEIVMRPAIENVVNKKSLRLPLKPLSEVMSSEMSSDLSSNAMGNNHHRKKAGGIPLTPLMAKLSILALNEDRNSGNGWGDTTPGYENIATNVDGSRNHLRRPILTRGDDAADVVTSPQANEDASSVGGLQRVELYICGQQNMTLLLLLEHGSSSNRHIVHNMFEICVAKFPHMESHLNQLLNINVEGDKSDGGYSFLCLDSKWDALQRNGAWNPMELATLEYMHRDLQKTSEITDVTLRSNDSVFYGYKCGRGEFFYKETAHQAAGIPPPSDPMGNIAMRAKARLERDHSFMLL